MSCSQLWFARNQIFANRGFCFKTQRARSVFGRGCFAPFGRLRGFERREVSRIRRWERRRGC
ncbi:MAG: YARHG domain-containing protein [Pseudomonadota bacterium]